MNSLLSDKKNEGRERRLTLVQIVDYCKECVSWEEAQPIEAMLLKLLFGKGTKEDSELIQSIDDEFKARAQGGTTFKDAQVMMTNHFHEAVENVYNNVKEE